MQWPRRPYLFSTSPQAYYLSEIISYITLVTYTVHAQGLPCCFLSTHNMFLPEVLLDFFSLPGMFLFQIASCLIPHLCQILLEDCLLIEAFPDQPVKNPTCSLPLDLPLFFPCFVFLRTVLSPLTYVYLSRVSIFAHFVHQHVPKA